ncbi:unnamed protein product [Kluyveromyces dobzhanskii CBS 2104]|uniref:WGS project CCBQ000000000 data, contig 00015 n=1 Tax=Kluyveromyces dobzhanskii CBS 2104 TaxID=1427455 RepID=A0A0A8LBD7_9SACH|nr:unnamed protein product [Kluyveromyces dobzhanskii CBS 2104]
MLPLEELLDEELFCVHNEELLREFNDFLAKSHCDENLLFVKATNPFMKQDSELLFEQWCEVYHRYIEEDSPKECNFPASIRSGFDKSFHEQTLPLKEQIEQARLHIMTLLQDAYTKFQRHSDTKNLNCYCRKDHDYFHRSHRDVRHTNSGITVNIPLTQEDIALVSPMLDKFSECALDENDDEGDDEEEEEEEEGDDEASNSGPLEYQKAGLDVKLRPRTKSSPPPPPSSSFRPRTPPSPSVASSSSTQRFFEPSRTPLERTQHNQQQQIIPPSLTPSLPSAQRLNKLHRYSVSSSSKGSTASSSSSVSSQSPTVNSSQKFSKLVHRLKFGRSSSSSGGQSGPQSWQP